jgi:hypothetical protein
LALYPLASMCSDCRAWGMLMHPLSGANTPTNDEVFVNIGAMNRHIGSLEARIDEMKEEIATLKAPK